MFIWQHCEKKLFIGAGQSFWDESASVFARNQSIGVPPPNTLVVKDDNGDDDDSAEKASDTLDSGVQKG